MPINSVLIVDADPDWQSSLAGLIPKYFPGASVLTAAQYTPSTEKRILTGPLAQGSEDAPAPPSEAPPMSAADLYITCSIYGHIGAVVRWADRVRATQPDAHIAVLTSSPDTSDLRDALASHNIAYLKKTNMPQDLETLAAKLR